ncbi:MAG: hypothetical protein ACFFD4_33095 [Candidatus Odinarchaeota archaeon]
MIKKIETEDDARKFLEEFASHSSFTYADSSLSTTNWGSTTLKMENGIMKSCSQGSSWSDQDWNIIDSPVDLILKNKEDISKAFSDSCLGWDIF